MRPSQSFCTKNFVARVVVTNVYWVSRGVRPCRCAYGRDVCSFPRPEQVTRYTELMPMRGWWLTSQTVPGSLTFPGEARDMSDTPTTPNAQQFRSESGTLGRVRAGRHPYRRGMVRARAVALAVHVIGTLPL